MADQTRKRTIVGVPLTPQTLLRMGALGKRQPALTEFDPNGSWVNSYRIYTCHGFIEAGNEDVGALRIERIPGTGNGDFRLKIRQRTVHDAGSVHFLEAEARCKGDRLATLVDWKLSSRFEDLHGEPIPDLTCREAGRTASGTLTTIRSDRPIKSNLSTPLTSDWGLFEAVQRLATGGPAPPEFDLLEELSLLRKRQRISYNGLFRVRQRRWRPMHWFRQTGHGLLPYEYWLDQNHRLLVAASHLKAYILDDKAGEAVAARLRAIRERAANRAGRRNG